MRSLLGWLRLGWLETPGTSDAVLQEPYVDVYDNNNDNTNNNNSIINNNNNNRSFTLLPCHEQSPNHRHRNLKAFEERIQTMFMFVMSQSNIILYICWG